MLGRVEGPDRATALAQLLAGYSTVVTRDAGGRLSQIRVLAAGTGDSATAVTAGPKLIDQASEVAAGASPAPASMPRSREAPQLTPPMPGSAGPVPASDAGTGLEAGGIVPPGTPPAPQFEGILPPGTPIPDDLTDGILPPGTPIPEDLPDGIVPPGTPIPPDLPDGIVPPGTPVPEDLPDGIVPTDDPDSP